MAILALLLFLNFSSEHGARKTTEESGRVNFWATSIARYSSHPGRIRTIPVTNNANAAATGIIANRVRRLPATLGTLPSGICIPALSMKRANALLTSNCPAL